MALPSHCESAAFKQDMKLLYMNLHSILNTWLDIWHDMTWHLMWPDIWQDLRYDITEYVKWYIIHYMTYDKMWHGKFPEIYDILYDTKCEETWHPRWHDKTFLCDIIWHTLNETWHQTLYIRWNNTKFPTRHVKLFVSLNKLTWGDTWHDLRWHFKTWNLNFME